jgi:hypothetical protein
MSVPNGNRSDLHVQTTPAEPVYVTRNVAANMSGVNFRTFERHAVPSAWRREADGKLSALYSEATVEAFRTSWSDGRFGGTE